MDTRTCDRVHVHEAAHCLAAWDCNVPVACVQFPAGGGGRVLLDNEPSDPRKSWMISHAGAEAERQWLFNRAEPSFEDVMLSGVPRNWKEAAAWRQQLSNWVGETLSDIVHLAMELSARSNWGATELGKLVWSDSAFKPYRSLYAKPAMPAARSRPSYYSTAKPATLVDSAKLFAGILNDPILADVMQDLRAQRLHGPNARVATRAGAGLF